MGFAHNAADMFFSICHPFQILFLYLQNSIYTHMQVLSDFKQLVEQMTTTTLSNHNEKWNSINENKK